MLPPDLVPARTRFPDRARLALAPILAGWLLLAGAVEAGAGVAPERIGVEPASIELIANGGRARQQVAVTGYYADGSVRDHYFNAGIDFKPIAPLDFALVYKRERASNGFISTSNGNIGGLDRGKYDEIGLFGQLVF